MDATWARAVQRLAGPLLLVVSLGLYLAGYMLAAQILAVVVIGWSARGLVDARVTLAEIAELRRLLGLKP